MAFWWNREWGVWNFEETELYQYYQIQNTDIFVGRAHFLREGKWYRKFWPKIEILGIFWGRSLGHYIAFCDKTSTSTLDKIKAKSKRVFKIKIYLLVICLNKLLQVLTFIVFGCHKCHMVLEISFFYFFKHYLHLSEIKYPGAD